MRPLDFIVNRLGLSVYVAISSVWRIRRTSRFRPATAAGRFGERLSRFVEWLGLGRPVVGYARKQLDFPFGSFEQLVAALEMFDALLVAGQRLGKAELALFQIVTIPVAGHIAARVGYRTDLIRRDLLSVDELAEQIDRQEREEEEARLRFR